MKWTNSLRKFLTQLLVQGFNSTILLTLPYSFPQVFSSLNSVDSLFHFLSPFQSKKYLCAFNWKIKRVHLCLHAHKHKIAMVLLKYFPGKYLIV